MVTTEEAMGALLDRISALEHELKRLEEKYEGMNAEEMYNRSKEYISNNRVVWDRIKNDAREAAKNNTRFSIAREFEALREEKWLQKNEADEYKCNNSYRACLTRFLMVEEPEIVRHVSCRRSKVDRFFPELEEVLNAKD